MTQDMIKSVLSIMTVDKCLRCKEVETGPIVTLCGGCRDEMMQDAQDTATEEDIDNAD